MSTELDLSFASEYDLICDKDRILNVLINCTYLNAGVVTNFDFTPYTFATLVVKNAQGTIMMVFSTDDGSIELQANGILKLYKTPEEMNGIRSGSYNYDMYISSNDLPKRGFLRGKISFNQNTAN